MKIIIFADVGFFFKGCTRIMFRVVVDGVNFKLHYK